MNNSSNVTAATMTDEFLSSNKRPLLYYILTLVARLIKNYFIPGSPNMCHLPPWNVTFLIVFVPRPEHVPL
jgi:hypothetical protein